MPKTLLAIFSCHQYDYKHSEYQDWYTRPVKLRVEGIRASWLKDVDVDYKFFMGRPPKRYKEVARGNVVGLELDKSFRDPREDEVFLDVNDGYYYSAEKIRAIIKYALANGYDRLVKVDDDVYVYWDRLMANAPEDAWVGGGSPNAIAGPCYWLRKSSLQILNANSAPHWAEDAWVGTVLLNNNVKPKFDSRYYIAPQTKTNQYISDEELSKPNDYLTIHSLSPAQMVKLYEEERCKKSSASLLPASVPAQPSAITFPSMTFPCQSLGTTDLILETIPSFEPSISANLETSSTSSTDSSPITDTMI